MYCIHCGNKLEEDAKFCSRCGAQVNQQTTDCSEVFPSKEIPDTNSADTESISTVSSEAVDVQTETVLDASSEAVDVQTETVLDASSQGNSESSTLKEAVTSNRKRSSRRVPVILIVALALALLSSIAYAAYYIYTEVYLPQQEAQQEEQQQEELTEGQEEEESAESEPTYSSEVVTQIVHIPEEGTVYGDDEEQEWNYIQFSSSSENEALDDLNNQIKEDFDQTATDAENWTGYYELTLHQSSEVTYLEGNIASVLTSAYETNLGPHGWSVYKNAIYNLEEGRQITPAEYFDVDEETIYEWTRTALQTWIEDNPDETDFNLTPFTRFSTTIQEEVESILSYADNSQFYLTTDGLVFCTNDYDLGTFAAGSQHILVKAFNDEELEGTSVWQSNVDLSEMTDEEQEEYFNSLESSMEQ